MLVCIVNHSCRTEISGYSPRHIVWNLESDIICLKILIIFDSRSKEAQNLFYRCASLQIGIVFVNIKRNLLVECSENHIVKQISLLQNSVKNIYSPATELAAVFDFDNIVKIAVCHKIIEDILNSQNFQLVW